MSTPHIVILGSGFAALTAVRALRKRNSQARITLVAPAEIAGRFEPFEVVEGN